jgi:hypothetical protein
MIFRTAALLNVCYSMGMCSSQWNQLKRIRNAEVEGSNPFCSTSNSHHSNNLAPRIQLGPSSRVANMCTEITAQKDRKTVENRSGCKTVEGSSNRIVVTYNNLAFLSVTRRAALSAWPQYSLKEFRKAFTLTDSRHATHSQKTAASTTRAAFVSSLHQTRLTHIAAWKNQ